MKPATIDNYLAALEKLRRFIRAAVPQAEGCISYGVPALRLQGRMLVAFGAAAKHCAFYPGAFPIAALQDELKSYGTSKGTVRFPADQPLPAALLRKLVKARLAEHRPRAAKKIDRA